MLAWRTVPLRGAHGNTWWGWKVRKKMLPGVVAAVVVATWSCARSSAAHAAASDAPALCGVASAQGEGKLEGVLVTARRKEAPFSVTVSTNEQGR